MMSEPHLVLPVTAVKAMTTGTNPAEGAVITIEALDRIVDLHFPAAVLARLEALLVHANLDQAERRAKH